MNLELKGKITSVTDLSGKSKKDGSPFTRFQYVIEEMAAEHPSSLVVTTFGDKIPKLSIGDEGVAKINMKASEFNGKYYNNLDMWYWKSEKAPLPY